MKTVRIAALLLASVSFIATFAATSAQAGTIVCVETNLDSFCMELMDAEAPAASAAFLAYVDAGLYNNTLFNQSARKNYLTGGLYKTPPPILTTTVVTANSSGVITSSSTTTSTGTYTDVSKSSTATDSSNNTTTTAISVSPSDKLDPITVLNLALPVTATPQSTRTRGSVAFVFNQGFRSTFRINDTDNSNTIQTDTTSTFAHILGSGMDVVDRLSKLTVHSLGYSHLAEAPMLQLDNKVTADDLVQIKRIYRYAGTMADFDVYGVNFPPVSTAPVMEDVVCMATNLGELCVKLFPGDAPLSVANFLSYVNRGSYNNTFLHRLVRGFIIQGGGYSLRDGFPVKVTADPPIANEYKRPNTYGTIAMAKLGGDPNSATSEWFINLGDNTSSLDTSNNGGYTVFGEVIPSSLAVLSYLSFATPTDISGTFGGAFSTTPMFVDPSGTTNNFVTVNTAFVTQRDTTAPIQAPLGPLAKIQTLGTYSYLYTGPGTRFAVRMNNKLYMIVLNQDSSGGDPNLFNVDLTRIIELIDNGRIAATLTGDVLTIPTIRFGDNVYTNLVLQLVDKRTLQFRMVSFEQI